MTHAVLGAVPYNRGMAKKQPNFPGPPGLPPFLVGDDKRAVVLRAAQKLFLQNGFSVTSMDAITQEAQVSKATVYAHFKSKDELFETLVRLGSESALSMTPPLKRAGGDPKAELLAFFEPFLMLLFKGAGYNWSRMVIAEANRHPKNAQFFYECTDGRITNWVEQYLKELAKEGLFPTKQVRSGAELLVNMVLLGPLYRTLMIGPGEVDYQHSLKAGVDLLLSIATVK